MKTYEYFTKNNENEIYIEIRDSNKKGYAVWDNGSCVSDYALNKEQAVKIANWCLRERLSEVA